MSTKHAARVSVALVIRDAECMRHRILISVVCLAVLYPHYLIKGTTFEGEKLFSIKCVFFFLYNFCVKHFSFYNEFSEI